MSERVLAIIPARSGSKGLKNKNVMMLNGKPLLAYSIEAAKDSKLFDTIHVSTDSLQYAAIAKQYGADEPFLRDKAHSQDHSSSWDVVREVLLKYAHIGKEFDTCILLQPTSPLRNSSDINKAYSLFLQRKAESLTSVSKVVHPVQWCFQLDESCSMHYFAESPFKNNRRQDLLPYYMENGAIYIVSTNRVMDPKFDFYSGRCFAYVMDYYRSIDIDSLEDFIIAEALLKAKDRNLRNE